MYPQHRKSHAVAGILALLTALWGWSVPVQGAVHLVAPGGDNGDRFGAAASELEDINGDGRWEFLVGAPYDQTAGLDAGAVHLWLGRDALTVAPDYTWSGTSPELFGFAVARIGDVNNDGTGDWAVGAPGSNAAGAQAGRVYVFYGGPNPSATADVVIDGAVGGDQFGYAVSAAGDFDGDGIDDFIVGAPYSDLRAQNAGAAYVIYGAPGGPSTDLADATVFTGQIADDNFGWSVSDAGNFLGGAAACVAVGAPLSNTYGGLDGGALFVYEGALAGASPDTTIDFATGIGSAAKANSSFGFCVREVGSFDGDGYSDLAVGAPLCDQSGTDAGRVEIFRGGTSPSTTAYRYVNGAVGGDQLGYCIARVHDVTGTSLDDVLLGAPYQDATAADGGRAYLFAGGSASQNSAESLPVIAVDPLQAGTAAGDEFGFAVASAGDFDGDGIFDYAVGAPGGNDLASATSGYVYLVDSSQNVVANTLAAWDPAWNETGALQVDFALSPLGAAVQAIRVDRTVRDGSGYPVRETVWDGPAVLPGACPAGACLQVAAMGYRLVDPGAGQAAVDGEISYDLSVQTNDGRTVDLGAQPGPDPQGVPVPVVGVVIEDVWPNPANPQVVIAYRAPAGAAVSARIVDLRGRVIRTLPVDAGTGRQQQVTWDGREDAGGPAASGLYLVDIRSGDDRQTRPVVLAR